MPHKFACHAPTVASLMIAVAVAAGPASALGQPAGASQDPAASALARGWAAYAEGRYDQAVAQADAALRIDARDHAAVTLKVRAASRRGLTASLDAYETWRAGAPAEDLSLLDTVARTALEELARSGDQMVAAGALRRLAQAGIASAARRLEELTSGGAAPDLQLALLGDADAAGRLLAQPAATAPPQALARALTAAGPKAVPRLRELLAHPAVPVRIAAILSLGKVGSAQAVQALTPLLNDQSVRDYAAVALLRAGDTSSAAIVDELLTSPLPDVRLMAADAYAARGAGPWVDALKPMLSEGNGVTRVRAAELLAPHVEEAAAVLRAAATDANPVVRAEASRALEAVSAGVKPEGQAQGQPCSPNLEALRRMLRDADPNVRLHAAGSLLALVRSNG